ncbi:hypothetical protein D3C80_793880 [compost metagenome]
MDGQAEVGAEPLTRRHLAGDADGQVGRASVWRRRLEGCAGLALGQTSGALQDLGRAVQMTGAVAADVDLNAHVGGRRRRRRLLGQGCGGRERHQKRKKEADRSSRGWAEAVRPRRLAPGRARTRRDDEPEASDGDLRPGASPRPAVNDEAKGRTQMGEDRRHGADQNRVSRSISRRSDDSGAPAISSADSQRALIAVFLPKA